MKAIAFDLTDKSSRERYDHLFESCPNALIQQSSYWAEVIKDLGPDKPIFLLCQDNNQDLVAGMPLYLFEHNLGNILTSIPQHGPLGGIFFREGMPDSKINHIYSTLLGCAQDLAKKNHCISLTIISNPFFQDIDLYLRYLSPTFVLENFTQSVSLTDFFENGEIIWHDYNQRSSNLSRNIRKAKSANFFVEPCKTDKELKLWYDIHEQRHRAIGASPLSLQLFQNIRRVLESRDKAQLLLVKHENKIVSGCVYIFHQYIADVFMPSMDIRFSKQAPNFLNTEQFLFYAQRQGVRTMNWQSSPSRESGVYRYKKQWGSTEASYYFVTKLLCDPERIKKMGLETIKAAYPQHYVVPYAAFEQGFHNKYFKKG